MAYRIRPCRSLDELGQAAGAIGHYFGWVPTGEEVERFSQVLPFERMHAAFDGKEIVGGAGVFPFEMTVPGGPVRCAGVTIVGVLPTHRRRGLLSRMMRAQIDDIHEREEPFAVALGLRAHDLRPLRVRPRLPHSRSAFAADLGGASGGNAPADRPGAPRRAGRGAASLPAPLPEGGERDPGIHLSLEGVVGATPLARRAVAASSQAPDRSTGRCSRSTGVPPAMRSTASSSRRTTGTGSGTCGSSRRSEWTRWRRARSGVSCSRSTGPTRSKPGCFRPITRCSTWWRDSTGSIFELAPGSGCGRSTSARASRPGATGLTAASASRSGTRSAPWNEGTWTLADGVAKRSSRRPDLRLSVQALGAAYLGGYSFAELSRAGLVEETSRGGLARADALFASDRAPWCPEIF